MTHRLSKINWDQRYAICSECGPLTPVYVWANGEGRKRAHCILGKRESTAARRLQRQREFEHDLNEQRRSAAIAAERERVAREEAEERRTRFIAEERARIAREEAEGGESPYR